jgi:O-antigen/teichoic acid export membrane protein
MIVNIIGVLVNIIGNLYAIPKYNFIGAAWITVLTDFMTTLLMTLAAIKISRIQLSKD